MKPTIGRIVHVFVPPDWNGGSDVAPAIITRVHSDTCVNLRVFYDGPGHAGPERRDWLTSYLLFGTREEAAPEGDAPGHAFWPPQAGHQPGGRPPRY